MGSFFPLTSATTILGVRVSCPHFYGGLTFSTGIHLIDIERKIGGTCDRIVDDAVLVGDI